MYLLRETHFSCLLRFFTRSPFILTFLYPYGLDSCSFQVKMTCPVVIWVSKHVVFFVRKIAKSKKLSRRLLRKTPKEHHPEAAGHYYNSWESSGTLRCLTTWSNSWVRFWVWSSRSDWPVLTRDKIQNSKIHSVDFCAKYHQNTTLQRLDDSPTPRCRCCSLKCLTLATPFWTESFKFLSTAGPGGSAPTTIWSWETNRCTGCFGKNPRSRFRTFEKLLEPQRNTFLEPGRSKVQMPPSPQFCYNQEYPWL